MTNAALVWVLLVWLPENGANKAAPREYRGLKTGYVFRAIDRAACEKRVQQAVANGNQASCISVDDHNLPEQR